MDFGDFTLSTSPDLTLGRTFIHPTQGQKSIHFQRTKKLPLRDGGDVALEAPLEQEGLGPPMPRFR